MTVPFTHVLHRLTSYEPGREWTDPVEDDRIVQDLEVNDPNHRPSAYKAYPAELSRIPLPRELPGTHVPATDVLAGRPVPAAAGWDLPALSRLLHLSAGVTRTTERDGQTFPFRAAGSAGGRFPLEVYLAVPAGHSLPAGVHWYHPAEHALVRLGPAPAGGSAAVLVTGVPWRTGWRYRERGYRHIYWDAGTMLSQLLALADSAGLPARLFADFPDGEVTALVGADGRHEFPVAVVALGPDEPALQPAGPAAAGELDADGREFGLVTAAQHAGDLEVLGAELPRGAAVTPAATGSASLDEVVLQRGSIRRMDPNRSLPLASLQAAMAAAMRGIDLPHWVAVNAVDGLAPGLYRWPDLSAVVRAGELREELYSVSLEQGLPRDAAFVVISAIELAGLSDRQYRQAQLAAGLVEGRLHLMAYALGAAATGMTFRDSDIPALLGQDLACLLWTCVGVPDYHTRPGGPPGAPATIRMVPPRNE